MKEKKDLLLTIIASNVRKKRHSLGISQEELADLADVHRTYIGMIERSEKNITVLTLQKISKALNVSLTDLINEE